MLREIRQLLIGPPLPTTSVRHERLDKIRALAALSPDALASVAYANQEIYLGLVVAGAAGLSYSWVIAVAIAGLLVIVSLSYSQVINAYPAGGGSYSVARENLGDAFGIIAASGLTISYVLNVAVSLTAGVAAIASAFPALWNFRIPIALLLLAIMTLANLRGLREAGTLMAVPIYLFIGMYLALIVYGIYVALTRGPGSLQNIAPAAVETVAPFLILHTFAAGCTALTGVEAISNGVMIFNPPETKNANRTMAAMTILMGTIFLGTIALTQYLAVVAGAQETILSALARSVFGPGLLYLLVQSATLLVLVVAANTSYVGFPRLASLVARDGYLPRQLSFLGDRLVFSNGILLLAGLAGLLIVLFGGDTHLLIPLFAVGAFLAFTMSQAGMVVHWLRKRGLGWPLKVLMNGLGMVATGVALAIIAISRFVDGAWIVIFLIPLLVLVFRMIHHHYDDARKQLTLRGLPPSLAPLPEPRIVLPISGVHRGVIEALRYARSISDNVMAVFVEIEPESGKSVYKQWEEWGLDQDVPLVVVPSPYRSVIAPFLDFLDETDRKHNDGQLATVLLPEFIPARWWQTILHNQTAVVLQLALTYRPRRNMSKIRPVITIPMHLRE